MKKQIILDANTKILRLGGRPPTATLVLLIVEVMIFLVYAFADGPRWVTEHLAASGAGTLGRLKLYQPLSALWIHLDAPILLFNALTLWLFGSALERWWGARRYVLFCLATGVGGLVAGVLLGRIFSPATVVYGSGGVTLALLVALIAVFPLHLPLIHTGVLPLKARWLALILAGILLVQNAVSGAWLMIAVEFGGAAVSLLFLFSPRRLIGQVRVKQAKSRLKVIEGGKRDDKKWIN